MNANILKMKTIPRIFIGDFANKLTVNWFDKENVKVAKGRE